MKQVLLIITLTSILLISSVQLNAQETSTVIITARPFGFYGVRIQVIKPDYSVGEKTVDSNDRSTFFVEVKKVIDLWIQEGYTVSQVESHVYNESSNAMYSYFLIKTEE